MTIRFARCFDHEGPSRDFPLCSLRVEISLGNISAYVVAVAGVLAILYLVVVVFRSALAKIDTVCTVKIRGF